ncbi:MAG: cbb3-type cytochrome oxidase assembly protein CcoS [Acidobacteriota bacterium]
MRDYSYPSVYFAYFFFALLLAGALFFFFRSIKQGYWNEQSEEPKYRMLEDDEE